MLKDAGGMKLPAVKGIEQLEESEQGKKYGCHFSVRGAQKVKYILTKEYGGNINSGQSDS